MTPCCLVKSSLSPSITKWCVVSLHFFFLPPITYSLHGTYSTVSQCFKKLDKQPGKQVLRIAFS